MKRARFLIPLAIFVLLVALLGIGLKLNPKLVPSPLIGKPVPDFSLPDVKDPQKRVTKEDLFGQVSLVNVWASWCVSCRAEHPLLVALSKTGRVAIYGIDYKDKREDALRWLELYGDPYVASAFDEDGRVAIEWGVYGTPETFVVDKGGIIRYKHVGPLTEAVIKEEILPLIEELEKE